MSGYSAAVVTLTVGDELSGQNTSYVAGAAADDAGNVAAGEAGVAADPKVTLSAGAAGAAVETDS